MTMIGIERGAYPVIVEMLSDRGKFSEWSNAYSEKHENQLADLQWS